MPASKELSTYFRTIQQLILDYAPNTITQYESARTGMRVVVVDQIGPKVRGAFVLATEIHDDSGAPHTLEHLVFMGSRSYKYKGLLDKLATRAYSNTNAWTATDRTNYTLSTAGWAGFKQILPVYLEHIILPTLTNEGCYTEVHHIDGEGKDAGVVYSEMQGRENTQGDLMYLKAQRLLYPKGNGFRYETGGLMERLRVLSADRIREFHRAMYQPKNMCLVISGEINHAELLHVLDKFEDTIVADVPSMDAPFKRPWVESELQPTPPLTKTVIEEVQFPDEDESMGEITVAFLGPEITDHIACTAMGVLLIYLCESSASVIENTLVEKEQVCSAADYFLDGQPRTIVWFNLHSVKTTKLRKVEQRLIDILASAAADEFDMVYLHDCIKRWSRQIKIGCEDSAGKFLSSSILEDHLYGHRDGRDLKELETLEELDVIEKWTEQQWQAFLSKYLVDAHHISVLGVPSKGLREEIDGEEEARVKAQKENLGENGLKKLTETLKAARAENDKPVPDELLEQFPVPSTDSIHFITTTSAQAGRARKASSVPQNGFHENVIQKIIDKNDENSGLFLHFEHIPSSFVRIKIDMCTSSVPLELKALLPLYMEMFFNTPVMRDGQYMKFEDVVLALEKETMEFEIHKEIFNWELQSIYFEIEPEKYEVIISWIRTLLFNAVPDASRLASNLTKILADVPDDKRDGESMALAVNNMSQHIRAARTRATNVLTKAVYLKRFRKVLKSDPEAAISKFSELCRILHRPENFRIFVSANIEKLANPVSAWKALTSGLELSRPLEPIDDRKATLSNAGKNPGSFAYIVPMSTIDSSWSAFTSKGPSTYDDPDLPALMVAQAYMNACEGPFWVAVRGSGRAYGSYFSRSTGTGLIQMVFHRSNDMYKAFVAAKEQVEGHANGTIAFNKFSLEGAVSETVLGFVNGVSNMAMAAEDSFASQVILGISKDWTQEMLAKVEKVTTEEVRAAVQKYMMPLFCPETANMVITCAQLMKEKVEKDFAHFKPEVRDLDSFQDDYGLVVEGGDDDDDDEETEEDGEDDEIGISSEEDDGMDCDDE